MAKKRNHKKQQKRVLQTSSGPVAVPVATEAVASQPAQARSTGLEAGEQYIRRDIMRILFLLAIIALILTGLVITNGRSSLLFDAGKTVAHFLKLQ